MQKYIGAQMNE